ncbi:MAG: ribonuclease E/G, partial [Emcibacteraceae bacterium]|nr:ribonuclease E/G [Emcibacteraceae bacterium]
LYRDHSPSYVGAIYQGRVTKISSEFQAAFVELNKNLSGFLPLKFLPKTPGKKPKDLTTLLHEGQRIIVQVTADASPGKSLKLTGRIELVSTAVVLHPFRVGAFVSSRIKDPDRRAELKEFGQTLDIENIGLTFRTQAELIPLEQLKATADKLISHWQQISKIPKCPALLTQGPNPVEQIMREFTGVDVEKIIIDHASAMKDAVGWANTFAPDLVDKITPHKEKQPLFSQYEVDDEIEQMTDIHVTLKSGAWITIEPTEALTVIDVNMGDAHFSSDHEKQIFSLNREAAHEIFRQLRLRGIGGIIVIDFIDMANKGQIKSLHHYIDELMQRDPLPIQRGNISSFGLLELTRKAVQQDLGQLLLAKNILSKNVVSGSLDILRTAEQEANEKPGQPITIKVDGEIKKWLDGQSQILDKFQKRTGSILKMELK